MNAKTIVLFVLFLTFGFIAKAEESRLTDATIPGGIVYSDGKSAIYYDFETKKESNLTSHLPGVVVRPPFAASENCKWLVYLQDSKFYVIELPLGIPRIIQADVMMRSKGNVNSRKGALYVPGREEDIIWRGEIKNLSISPDGVRFAFDGTHICSGWVMLNHGNLDALMRFASAGMLSQDAAVKSDLIFGALPLYVKRNDSFNGIFYLSTIKNLYNPPSPDPFTPAFGHNVLRPPALLYKVANQENGHGGAARTSVSEGGETLGRVSRVPQNIYSARCIKKHAGLLTFQKTQAWESGNKTAAFVYQIGNQQVIEIQTLDAKYSGAGSDYYDINTVQLVLKNHAPKNCREIEIQGQFSGIVFMAWKPDGSLSLFTIQGNVYLIKSEDIKNTFENSRVELFPNKYDRKLASQRPVNNILIPKLESVASGIEGTCFNWVSNDSFIFLGKDDSVYICSQGKTEKVLDSIGRFYYCSSSPFKGSKDSDKLPATSGTNKVTSAMLTTGSAMLTTGATFRLNIGNIRTVWTQRELGATTVWLVLPKNHPIQYALVEDKNDIGDVNNPLEYKYLPRQIQKQEFEKITSKTKTSADKKKEMVIKGTGILGGAMVPLNSIIILKLGNAYIAIKPVSVGIKKEKTEDELKTEKNYTTGSEKVTHWEMCYEWKYWSEVITAKETVVKKTPEKEMWEISTAPIKKEFYIGKTKFFWKEILEHERMVLPDDEAEEISSLKLIVDKTIQYGFTFDGTQKNISDPSKYNFRNAPDAQRRNRGVGWNHESILVLKIGDGYVAIRPLERRKDWIQYKWKYWPAVPPMQEVLAKTALN